VELQLVLESLQYKALVLRYESRHGALRLGERFSPSPSGTMKVVGCRLREVEVVYVAGLRKIEPSARYVCRNQQETFFLDLLQTDITFMALSINIINICTDKEFNR
jgi:hypothetical protein